MGEKGEDNRIKSEGRKDDGKEKEEEKKDKIKTKKRNKAYPCTV